MIDLISQFEEVRLVYRNKTRAHDRPKVNCASKAFDIFHQIWDKDQIGLVEECKLLLLDRQLRLMSLANISYGGMTEAIIDPRMVFAIALKRRAHNIILAHNHPTGSLQPSEADKALTRRITFLGEMMRIQLGDHLIVTREGYRSIVSDECGSLENG